MRWSRLHTFRSFHFRWKLRDRVKTRQQHFFYFSHTFWSDFLRSIKTNVYFVFPIRHFEPLLRFWKWYFLNSYKISRNIIIVSRTKKKLFKKKCDTMMIWCRYCTRQLLIQYNNNEHMFFAADICDFQSASQCLKYHYYCDRSNWNKMPYLP